MKGNRFGCAIVSLILVCVMLFNLSGCSTTVQAENLMDGITPNNVEVKTDLSSHNAEVTDFAVRLFKASAENGKNALISPLSVIYALAMTANGAENETLKQMESVLGMKAEDLNLYLYSYMKNLTQDSESVLHLANSIWFNDSERFTVNKDFLQKNADYYGAGIYKAPFDEQTCKDINNWVYKNTDEMISNILDNIPTEAVMYLVNALAFESEWSDVYNRNQVRDGEFTKENGEKQDAEFMYSTEFRYLEDEKAKGFIKYYKDYEYAFVAMLPNEDVSVSEYVESLEGDSLNKMLANPQKIDVTAAIPKFETEYNVGMAGILKAMGMTNAFDAKNAEFGKLGKSDAGNVYISRVIHKTFISVAEKGTKAGAATIIESVDKSASEPQEIKEVYLNRPFVYMLVDCENNIPFFIGTVMDVK